MADCRMFGQNKNYLNHSSMNGLLLFIYTMAQLFAPQSCTLETASNNTSCEAESTCIKCAIRPQCSWLQGYQWCRSKSYYNKYTSHVVHSKEECPRFSVVTEYDHNNRSTILKYNVKLSNEPVSFIRFLNDSDFICNSAGIDKSVIEVDEMACSTRIDLNYLVLNVEHLAVAFLFYVKYNGIIPQLNNINKIYEKIYDHQCVEDRMNDHCGTCIWNDDDFTRCVTLCSYKYSSKECHNELYLEQNFVGNFWNFTSQKVNNRCVPINVTGVDPLSGTMAGGTKITITVKNHRKYAVIRNFTVTVAGTLCTNLSKAGHDTFTCITTPPPDDANEPPSGPVLVKYTSKNGYVMDVESSQIFQFHVGSTCGAPRPVLGSRQELYGLELGGTSVTLNGSRFIKPCIASSVRMFVQMPNGSMQFSSSLCNTPVHDSYLVCRTPQLNSSNVWDVNKPNFTSVLNFGLEVNFAGNQSLFVNGPLNSYYRVLDNYPVLENFEIVLGGSVVIYGNHLRHIHPDDVRIRFQDLVDTDCKVTSATKSSFVCMPITSVVVSKRMFVKIGNSLTYNVTRRPSVFYKLIWYFMVPWLILVVLALACFYQINSRYNVPKTADASPVNSNDFDTHKALL